MLKDLNTAQKSLSIADRLKVEVSSLKLYKGFFINKFPNIVSKLQTYDNATQLRFFDDFLGAEESILTKLNTETNRIDLWKAFENESFLAGDGAMRGRYIRDLGIVPSENIAVLQDIISWRKSIIKTLNNNGLDINLGEFTTKTNISFTEIQYKINGIEQEPLKLLGISGVEPSNQLLAKTDGIIDGFKITSSPPAKNSDRFFDAFAPFNKDSEGRTIEEAMFIIGKKKGLFNARPSDPKSFITQILQDSDVRIKMSSEMSSCPSCEGIISTFNNSNKAANAANQDIKFSFGVHFE